jgi:hypothetical protein
MKGYTVTQYRYTPKGKADLFIAIKASTSWRAFKAAYKIKGTKPAYPIEQIEQIALMLNIDVTPFTVK